jgi:hypothetical protein
MRVITVSLSSIEKEYENLAVSLGCFGQKKARMHLSSSTTKNVFF